MRRIAGYPRGFYSFLVVVLLLLTATGLLLVPHMLTMRMDWDVPLSIDGDTRLASAALHCGAAFLAMTLLGALGTVHMRAGWHRRQNRVSGVSVVALFALLMFTAVGVYYFGDEELSRWSSLLHTLAGLSLVGASLWHGVAGHLIYNRRVHRQHRAEPPRGEPVYASAQVSAQITELSGRIDNPTDIKARAVADR